MAWKGILVVIGILGVITVVVLILFAFGVFSDNGGNNNGGNGGGNNNGDNKDKKVISLVDENGSTTFVQASNKGTLLFYASGGDPLKRVQGTVFEKVDPKEETLRYSCTGKLSVTTFLLKAANKGKFFSVKDNNNVQLLPTTFTNKAKATRWAEIVSNGKSQLVATVPDNAFNSTPALPFLSTISKLLKFYSLDETQCYSSKVSAKLASPADRDSVEEETVDASSEGEEPQYVLSNPSGTKFFDFIDDKLGNKSEATRFQLYFSSSDQKTAEYQLETEIGNTQKVLGITKEGKLCLEERQKLDKIRWRIAREDSGNFFLVPKTEFVYKASLPDGEGQITVNGKKGEKTFQLVRS